MKKQIMKAAHEMAKMMEGHYAARLSMALRIVWERVKAANAIESQGTSAVFTKCNEWKKERAHRFYIDGILKQAVRYTPLYATLDEIKFSAYYDVLRDEVVFSECVRSKQRLVEGFIREYLAAQKAA